jgi:hypothetical protein
MSVPDCETMHLGLSHSNSRATLVIFDTSVLHCATFDLDESQSGTFTLPLPLSGQTAVRRFESRASMLLSDSVEVQDLPKHILTQSFATSFTLQDIGCMVRVELGTTEDTAHEASMGAIDWCKGIGGISI